MTNSQDLASGVENCLRKVRSIEGDIQNESMLRKDLGFDSIDIADLLFEVGREFKTPISFRDLNLFFRENIRREDWDLSFDELLRFVGSKIKK